MEESISLQELLQILKKRLLLIILLIIIGTTTSGVFTSFFVTPIYQASTQLVVSRAGNNTMVTSSDITAINHMMNTFNDILLSPAILNQVIEELNITATASGLRNQMTARNASNSHVITLTVQNESPTLARNIANQTAEIFSYRAPAIMNVDSIITVLAEAQTPNNPMNTNLVMNIGIGFIIGAMTGVFLAFSLEFLDKRVKTEQEVEKLINLPTLGTIEFEKKKKMTRGSKRSLITVIDPKSPISEQYRTIRTNIQLSMIDKELKTLTFTSAAPGEGKSTTIANLAITLAYQGDKVLLIDADLRRPTMHQLMGVRNRYGLTTMITKKMKKSAIVSAPRISNLHVLPSGPIPPNPSELLGSKRMKNLISELSKEYDWILFDTPPVLGVTDAQILGNHCDGVILVLKSHQTEKRELVKAKELLDKANTNLLGTIMSGVNQKELGHKYYYYSDNE